MKKKLLIITVNSVARIGLQTYLSSLFSNYLTIDAVRYADVTGDSLETADYILYSSPEIRSLLSVPVPETTHQMICTRTFNHTYLHKIFQIPPGSIVYLVNDKETSAYEVIRQLQDFGISQYQFLPHYPGSGPASPLIQHAITVGELHLVPQNIPMVIDIGNRVPDMSTVSEIISYFHLPMSLANEITRNYINHLVQIMKLSNSQLAHGLNTQHITQIIINNIANGICLLDSHDEIRMANRAFSQMMGFEKKNPVGSSLSALLSGNGILCSIHSGTEHHFRNSGGIPIRLWVQEIDAINSSRMYLLHTYQEEEYGPPGDFAPVGHTLHSFGDIITAAPKMLNLLDNAKRISLNDFHIVIQGESGTEKEMLAQAIHRNSRHHDGPFVTLNLIALESSAVEKALLGYEEGAFFGARPGGQVGLLETAGGGTLFINGIQYMTHQIQALLLNVLQSGGFKKIGGCQTIPANIRIIAATAKNLYPLVLEGSFLDELFFTLNSVSLDTLPLRQRREDIPLLLNYFLKNDLNNPALVMEDIFSEHLCQFLTQYSWPGNAQEARNLCKYFSCIYSRRIIGLQELPSYILNQITEVQKQLSQPEQLVLQLISSNPRIGRTAICRLLARQDMEITDGKVRGLLQDLVKAGYIKVNRTKGGCEITELGSLILQ